MSATEDDDVHRLPKKIGVTLKSFRYKMEKSMDNLAQSMKSIEKTKTDKMKKVLDTYQEITSILVQNNKMVCLTLTKVWSRRYDHRFVSI